MKNNKGSNTNINTYTNTNTNMNTITNMNITPPISINNHNTHNVMSFNSQIIQPHIPMIFSPSNRKNSNKKIEVLSSLEQYKSHSQLLENR